MGDASKAVFLSYASQDAEAARRIAEALRAAGVEVWFDQSELVGGDAWDQKIRKQIRECALLIPVISKTTQARREAYFRLEWKLADERTHLMAKGTPFLLPVTIDGTNDRGALVPDSFLAVQWTKAPWGETPPAFCARVKELLSGSDVVAHLEGTRESSVPDGRRHATPLRKSPRWLVPAVVAGVVIAAGAMWLTRTPAENPVQRKPDFNLPTVSAPALTESEQLTARAYAMTQRLSFTPDDLAIAESLTERATSLEPDSGRAWSVRAWVQGSYLMRNWDRSPQRLQDTQAFAKRALALSPDDGDALNALAVVMEKQGASSEAEKLSRRALAIDPSNFRSRALLARALDRQDRKAEGRVVLQEAVTLDPGNALAHYELANSYVPFGTSSVVPTEADVKAALEEFDAALAVHPFASVLVAKAMLLGGRRGDLPGMLAALDQLEQMALTERTSERAIFVTFIGGLWAHDPARIHRAASLMSQDYFEDLVLASPKAWWEALAYRLEGKDVLAQMSWSLAETFLRKQLAEQPANPYLAPQLATSLAWLGKNEEAGRIIAPFEAAVRERESTWANSLLARYYAARGDATRAVTYLRSVLNSSVFITDYSLQLDPWWDKVRGQPEFEALLAEAKARIAGAREQSALSPAPVADAKSVAVLAFANLSDDKDNEYFSDGISEELLNVLAKIPGLKVTARTSSFSFKESKATAQEIGSTLGVNFLVEGSVRKSGDTVRIAARLSRASTNEQVWSESYTRELKDVFAVQSEIAETIVGHVREHLGGGVDSTARAEIHRQVDDASRGGTSSPDAYSLYLRATFQFNQRSAESYARAIGLFQEAVAIDSRFAAAWGGLAAAQALMAAEGYAESYSAGYEAARIASRRALEIEPNLGIALATLARIHVSYDWNWEEGRKASERAIAAAPNLPLVRDAAMWLAVAEGDEERALAHARAAVEVDPIDIGAHIRLTLAAWIFGHNEEALAAGRRAMELNPRSAFGSYAFTVACIGTGRFDEARNALGDIDPAYRLTCEALLYGVQGLKTEARAKAAQLGNSYGHRIAYQLGQIHALNGDPDLAFEWLEEAYRQRDSGMTMLRADPFLRSLHQDPRWTDLILRMKME